MKKSLIFTLIFTINYYFNAESFGDLLFQKQTPEPKVSVKEVFGLIKRFRGTDPSAVSQDIIDLFEAKVKAMIRNNNINTKETETGNTLLHYAILANNPAFAKILLDNGAKILEKNSAGVTPLNLILNSGNENLINSLKPYYEKIVAQEAMARSRKYLPGEVAGVVGEYAGAQDKKSAALAARISDWLKRK